MEDVSIWLTTSWMAMYVCVSVLVALTVWIVTYVAARLAGIAWHKSKREDLNYTMRELDKLTGRERECNGS